MIYEIEEIYGPQSECVSPSRQRLAVVILPARPFRLVSLWRATLVSSYLRPLGE